MNALLACAVATLVAGLGLYASIATRRNTRYFYTTNVICWLLIALFPVFLLFNFFPASTAEGAFFGIKMSGAVALFVFIWWYGTNRAIEAVKIDDLNAKIDQLEKRGTSGPSAPAGRQPKVITEFSQHTFRILKKKSRTIVLVTGGIDRVKFADIWVNSENTNMQMARYFDRSISATIRYLGSRRDDFGDVTDDIIAKELGALMGSRSSVQPSTVLATSAGSLLQSHNVKRIFHVAAARGQVGVGYGPIEKLDSCITNALERADHEPGCVSIVFPLLGTGTARANLSSVAEPLLLAAIGFLEQADVKQIQTVYFLAWTDVELETCQQILGRQTNRVAEA
jgi:O-acetyl-ADP-ribose deacetylase (regulator of RNase III)